MSKFTLQSTLPLPNTNLTIPRLGFGVYTSTGNTCIKSCLHAFKSGYRHVDSAQMYRNESQVGSAVVQSGIPRKDLFLTSKIFTPPGDVEKCYQSIIDSVQKLSGANEGGGEGCADLFLIHNKTSGYEGVKTLWLALEKAHKEGRCKAIGVSNFGRKHIEEMKDYATVWPPHVNQIELHPWCQQRNTVKYCFSQGIVVQAYCPLVRNQKASDPTLNGIAEKNEVTTGQVLIRYCLQKGWVPLPKSDTPSRIETNADLYGFEISDEDMKRLDGLDEGSRGALVMTAGDE